MAERIIIVTARVGRLIMGEVEIENVTQDCRDGNAIDCESLILKSISVCIQAYLHSYSD